MSGGELIVLHDRRDRPEANRLVRKLESAGYRVARQDGPGGLRRGKTDAPTVVLWSRHAGARSLRSALDNDAAVIAKLDSRAAPLGPQVTDLRGWRGQDRHQGWKTLLEAVGPAAHAASSKVIAAAPSAAKPIVAASSKPAKSSAPAKPAAEASEPKAKGGLSGVAIAIIVLAAMAALAGGAAFFVL